MTNSSNNKKVLYTLVVVVLAILISVSFYFLTQPKDDQQIIDVHSKGEITRSISQGQVNSGSEFKIKYNINLDSNQRFYLIEDTVPAGFEILDCKNNNNKIKLGEMNINFKNKIIECSIKAPQSAGTYQFNGQYGMEGLEKPVTISGDNTLIVI